jgi:hypothetical protein
MGQRDERQALNVDASTGEVMDGVFVYVPKKVRQENWFMAFQEASSKISTDKDFTASTFRVFHALLSKLDFENFILVNQAELSSQLGMKRSNFNREVNKLVQKGLLKKGPKSGVQVTFQLNPHFAWRGKASKVRDAQAQFGPLKVIEGGKAETKKIDGQADFEDWLNGPKDPA